MLRLEDFGEQAEDAAAELEHAQDVIKRLTLVGLYKLNPVDP
jgi:hypothetical protein